MIRKPNRTKRQKAKHGLYWCYKCDQQIVGRGGKCSNCGHKNDNDKGRFKKPFPVDACG